MSENNLRNSTRMGGGFQVEEFQPDSPAQRRTSSSQIDGTARPQRPNPVNPTSAAQRSAASTQGSGRTAASSASAATARRTSASSGSSATQRPASRPSASQSTRPGSTTRQTGTARQRPQSATQRPASRPQQAAGGQSGGGPTPPPQPRSPMPEWARLGVMAVVILLCIAGVAKIILSSGTQEDRTIIRPIVMATDTPAPTADTTVLAYNPDEGIVPADPSTATAAPEATNEPAAAPTEDWSATLATASPITIADEDLRSATIRMAGDVIIDWEMLQASYNMILDSYEFDDMLSMIGTTLSSADFTMINIDASLKKGKYGYSGYPTFTTPPTILTALKDAGVDLITMCNNHMLDSFCDGLVESVGLVDKAGLLHVGGFVDEEDSNTPEIIEINGIKVGFVCYTQTTNSVENQCDDRYKFLVKYLKKSDFAADVAKVKAAGAEVVIAIPHWGEEYQRQPETVTTGYARQLVAAGADLIIGGHPHVVQPAEYITTTDAQGNVRSALCVYSIGNFLTQHIDSYTESGIVLEFTIQERNDGSFSIIQPGYVPVFSWKQPVLDANGNEVKSTTKGREKRTVYKVKVLPIALYMSQAPEGMDEDQYQRMRQCWFDTLEIMGDNNVMQVLSE